MKCYKFHTNEIIVTHDVQHYMINVLRLENGHPIMIFSNINCILIGFLKTSSLLVSIKVINKIIYKVKPKIILVQSIINNDKLEKVIQNASVMNVNELFLLHSHKSKHIMYCFMNSKILRFNKIVQASSIQNHRPDLLKIKSKIMMSDLKDICNHFSGLKVFGEINSTNRLSMLLNDYIISYYGFLVIIGPEGGFNKEEKNKLITFGVLPVCLGKYVLRTEYASLVALSIYNDWYMYKIL